jgi:hypothetical protein
MKTARVGLTSSDILFLKQIYVKDPNEYGSHSLDIMDPLEPPPMSARAMEEARSYGQGRVMGGKAGDNYYIFQRRGLKDEPIPAPNRLVGGELVAIGSKEDPDNVEHTSRRRSSRQGGSSTSRTSRTSRTGRTARSYRTGVSQVDELKKEKLALKVSQILTLKSIRFVHIYVTVRRTNLMLFLDN